MSPLSPDVLGIALALTIAAFVAAFAFLLVYSLIWVYRDATRRGKPGWLCALLVFLFDWPISLLLWYVFRPALPAHCPGKPLKT